MSHNICRFQCPGLVTVQMFALKFKEHLEVSLISPMSLASMNTFLLLAIYKLLMVLMNMTTRWYIIIVNNC